jgi:type VI secretion system protein ImpF
MRRPKSDIRAPLLDRLVDTDPRRSSERIPKRTLTYREYKESVRRDLLWLLNTRTPYPARRLRDRELTVTEYGVPDFGERFAVSPDDRRHVGGELERFVRAFEPRLQEPRVFIREVPGHPKLLRVVFEGMLVLDRQTREPVAFPLVLDTEEDRYRPDEW